MPCKACQSANLQTLDGELNLSQPNVKGLKAAPIYVCRSILICLECGYAELVVPADELSLLKKAKSAIGS